MVLPEIMPVMLSQSLFNHGGRLPKAGPVDTATRSELVLPIGHTPFLRLGQLSVSERQEVE
jgi:hypothetical protein